jgi:hypothetical protein
MAKKKTAPVEIEVPFFEYLRRFYKANRGQIRFSYKDLTKKILDYNDPGSPGAFLRTPQFEALEIYVFLKEYLDNPRLCDLFDSWRNNRGKFQLKNTPRAGQQDLFQQEDSESYEKVFKKLEAMKQEYANYIFALTMGVGKTILMAVCIFYEFLLARKFPKDPRFCHNVIVFAPDTTVLQSLKEIMTFDKTRVIPPEYARSLEADIKFHFLDESGVTLNTLDKSSFNVVISNSQKIIRKRSNAEKTPADLLFGPETFAEKIADDPDADLYALDDEEGLTTNQRYKKLERLHQLGIYVDEAHHAFGKSLKKDMEDHESKTSLRLTIDSLARSLKNAGTQVVACYNYTGTPYVENQLMPEVVYAYSLKQAIENKYLKTAKVTKVVNAKSLEFVRNAIKSFVEEHGDSRYEGMLPKMAIFAATIDELEQELKPAVEATLSKLGLPLSALLVNVGDEKLTKQDDIREFRSLDTKESTKQFILLVGKGKEGWNCRSLFSVALYRQPKSKIFVLQATMRCLRSITEFQREGHVFLSEENYAILAAELEANFRLSIDEFQSKEDDEKVDKIVKPRKPPVFVEVVERKTLFNLREKSPAPGFSLDLDSLDTESYKITAQTMGITNLDSALGPKTDLSGLREDIGYSEVMLVAEIARYLNMSPLAVKDILEKTTEGISGILKYVNLANRILYEIVIPRLFKHLFKLEEFQGPEERVKKLLVKDPPEGQDGYEIRVKLDLFVEESSPQYKPLADRSFHLSGYGFDSNPELEFFKKNLPNGKIKKLWYTGMLTHGQTEFVVHYIDPESHALRAYYPDFLLELEDGAFVIVEIKADYMVNDPVILAKQEYAEKIAALNKMTYVMIPGTEAGRGIESFALL